MYYIICACLAQLCVRLTLSCCMLYVPHSSQIFILDKIQQLQLGACIFKKSGKSVNPDKMASSEVS